MPNASPDACASCGTRLLPEAAFCGNCGASISAPAPVAPEPIPPPASLPATRGAAAERRRRPTPLLAVAGALVVVAVSAGAAWLLLRDDGGSTAVVDASGGTVEVPGGGRIEFGAGALAELTSVDVSVVPAEEVPGEYPLDATSAGQTYRVEVAGDLASPVTVVLPFDPDSVETPREETVLFAGRYDEATGAWEPMLGLVDWDAGTITVQVEHFSLLSGFQRSVADFVGDIGDTLQGAAEGVLWLAGLETAEGPLCTRPHPKQIERIDFGDSLLPCIEERDSTTISLQVVNNRPYGQLLQLPAGSAVIEIDRGGFWDRIWSSMQSSLGGNLYLPPGARAILTLPADGAGEMLVQGTPDGGTLALDLATGVALRFFPGQTELIVQFMECVVATNEHSALPESGQLDDLATTIRDCLNSGVFDAYLPHLGPYWGIAVEALRGSVIGAHLTVDAADGLNYVSVRYADDAQRSPDAVPELNTVLPTAGARVTVVGTGDCLRIRSAPTTSSTRLGCLDDGTSATIEEGPREADGSTWYRLTGHGWVAGEFLATDAAYAVIKAIERRDVMFLVGRYRETTFECSVQWGDCDGEPDGTLRSAYAGTGGACHLFTYDDPEPVVRDFLETLRGAVIEIRATPEAADDKIGNLNLDYRRLGASGIEGSLGTVQLLHDGGIRFMATNAC